MTGHTLGASTYRMPYTNIPSAHVDFHCMFGYFEVSAEGQKSYWDKGNSSPQEAPNTISLTKAEKDVFVTATNIINAFITTSTIPSSNSSIQSDSINELKRYKELADSGIITQTEFEAKKKQILGL